MMINPLVLITIFLVMAAMTHITIATAQDTIFSANFTEEPKAEGEISDAHQVVAK